MILVNLIAPDIGHTHLLEHPFWPPEVALLVPIAFCLGDIWMGPSAAMQLAIAAWFCLVWGLVWFESNHMMWAILI